MNDLTSGTLKHNVAGMAIGGGENGIDGDRRLVYNPYNQHMGDEQKREGLYRIEASRHLMNEYDYKPSEKIDRMISKLKSIIREKKLDELGI